MTQELNHDDGKCIECGGYGYFTAEPAAIYGPGKIKCRACDGTGMLKTPMKCQHCGAVKQPLPEDERC